MATAPRKMPPRAAPTPMPAIAPVDSPLLLGSGVGWELEEAELVALLLVSEGGAVVVWEDVEAEAKSVGR